MTTRLEGLASRGQLSLAPPPTQEVGADLGRRGTYSDAYGDDGYTDEYDDGLGEHPSRRRGCGRAAIALMVVAALLLGTLAFAGLWVKRQIDPGGKLGDAVTVEVVQGQSTSDIGHVLQDADVITNATVWTWYVRLKGGGDIQAGTYEMHKNMSMGAALETLQKNPRPVGGLPVTVPEGLTINQMIERLVSPEHGVPGFDAERLRAAVNDPANRSIYLPPDQLNPEGTLFPETYDLREGDTEAALVQRMVAQMDDVLTQLDLNGGSAQLGYSPYQVLIIASLVEEEAKVPEERAMVARLIYNRLSQGIALGIDATSCYDSPNCPPTAADLQSESPYNTRNKPGLPPTPISSPSQASIDAALHPVEGDWIYSVIDADANNGTHVFTASYDVFQAAKVKCQAAGLC
ncbi:MAG TPA: endolytic transglycosylase MltG [Acidimicrobiales bacterium]